MKARSQELHPGLPDGRGPSIWTSFCCVSQVDEQGAELEEEHLGLEQLPALDAGVTRTCFTCLTTTLAPKFSDFADLEIEHSKVLCFALSHTASLKFN